MRRSETLLCTMLPLFLLLMVNGCGDDDVEGAPDAAADAAELDARADAGTGQSVTFHVATTQRESAVYIPCEGALVAFDAPGGQRTESLTDADGKVTFDGVDWSAGLAAVTAFKFGYSLRSGVNIDASWVADAHKVEGDVFLLLYELEPPPEPLVSQLVGSATGLVSPSHDYVVNTYGSNVSTEWSGAGTASFGVSVVSGEPFTIQAREQEYTELPSGQGYDRPIYRVMHWDHAPITLLTMGEVLDFNAHQMTPHTADASVLLPARLDSPLYSGFPTSSVCSLQSEHCHGWPTYVDIVPGAGYFAVSYLWVEPTGAQGPNTEFIIAEGQKYSLLLVEGYPQGGVLGRLLDVPEWVTPSVPTVPHPLHSPLQWQVFEADLPYVMLEVTRDQRVIWNIIAGANATSLTVPDPPSTVDPTIFLGSDALQGRLFTGDIDLSNNRWLSVAVPDYVQLQP